VACQVSDPKPTGDGATLAVTWLGHASVVIELDGVRLLTDPVLGRHLGPLVRIAPPVDPAATERVDAVLISHLHADHADARSLRRLGPDVRILAPAGATRWLAARGLRNVEELSTGDRAQVGAVTVRATPAVHGARRWRTGGAHVHPAGFVVAGSGSCYFAGDTDLFPEMAELAVGIDVALLPVAGWGPTVGAGHLDPGRASEAAAMVSPRVAVPIHWGTLALPWRSRREDPAAPARLFARLAAERAPAVDVRVLAPGERLELAARTRGDAPAGERPR
jgi:L-ascorbate metabolism protein UlaG (beta-lactamase superfamily)